MNTRLSLTAATLALAAVPALAQENPVFINQPSNVVLEPAPSPAPRRAGTNLLATSRREQNEWERDARFFVGLRSGVGIPPGGIGISPTMGVELGVAAPKGVGFGLHFFGAGNPPAVRALNTPPADWAVGAELDMRFYFQTVEPLTLYPTFSVGFMAGPAKETRENVVLPMLNPGFGARVKLGNLYASFEFGLASFTVPFLNCGLGWELDRQEPPHVLIQPQTMAPAAQG